MADENKSAVVYNVTLRYCSKGFCLSLRGKGRVLAYSSRWKTLFALRKQRVDARFSLFEAFFFPFPRDSIKLLRKALDFHACGNARQKLEKVKAIS